MGEGPSAIFVVENRLAAEPVGHRLVDQLGSGIDPIRVIRQMRCRVVELRPQFGRRRHVAQEGIDMRGWDASGKTHS